MAATAVVLGVVTGGKGGSAGEEAAFACNVLPEFVLVDGTAEGTGTRATGC
ncbi:MAG TPA: hypothetical protein VH744_06235 [Terriglobales bacterium]